MMTRKISFGQEERTDNMGIGGNTGGRKYSQHFFSIVLQFAVDRFTIEI